MKESIPVFKNFHFKSHYFSPSARAILNKYSSEVLEELRTPQFDKLRCLLKTEKRQKQARFIELLSSPEGITFLNNCYQVQCEYERRIKTQNQLDLAAISTALTLSSGIALTFALFATSALMITSLLPLIVLPILSVGIFSLVERYRSKETQSLLIKMKSKSLPEHLNEFLGIKESNTKPDPDPSTEHSYQSLFNSSCCDELKQERHLGPFQP